MFLFFALAAHPQIAMAQAEQDTALDLPDASPEQLPPASQKRGWERLDIGIKSGLSLSQFIGKDATSQIAEHTDKAALTFGIFGLIEVHRWVSIQPEILFMSKGRQVRINGTLSNTLDADYFEFPLLARITIPVSEQVNPYLLAGPAIGVLRRFQVKNETDGSITDRTDQARSTDLSAVAGAGIEVALTPRHALTLEGRYDRSLTRFLEDEQADVKNRAFAFMLGYQYSPFASSPSSSSLDSPMPDESDLMGTDSDDAGDQEVMD